MAFFDRVLIVVRGGGNLASGVIYRLHRAGFPVVVTELETPLFVRRMASYGEAVYSKSVTIEGIQARLAHDIEDTQRLLRTNIIPVLVDPEGLCISTLQPLILVDARMANVNLGTKIEDAALVIALGPGFIVGFDCRAAIETRRGYALGRVTWQGSTILDMSFGKVSENSQSQIRPLYAPNEGYVQPYAAIGDIVEAGHPIAKVQNEFIIAPFRGVLQGLIHERVWTSPGMKIGDLASRICRQTCFTISDKSLAVGGAALEAVLGAEQIRPHLAKATYETSTNV